MPNRTARRRWILIALATLAVGVVIVVRQAPSNDRLWIEEQARLPTASFAGNTVTVTDVRNWRHGEDEPLSRAYDTRTYDLDRIESVWLVLSPFGRWWRGPAHAFLSFGFEDGSFVGISVEARKEEGESYSLLKGLARRFEIAYIVADERDLIPLRANVWGDDVYLYPVTASRERVRALFVDMLERATALAREPAFYNTLTNNCTSVILQHVNHVAGRRVATGWDVLLPGYIDGLAAGLGLIDGDVARADVRERYRINERSLQYADAPDYSLRIRALN